jgi:hypothetical protein
VLSRSLLRTAKVTLLLPPLGLSRRFQFYKRSQFFIDAHNVTLSVVAVCIDNPDRNLRFIKPTDAR